MTSKISEIRNHLSLEKRLGAIQEDWCLVNYVASVNKNITHYDSWAEYSPAVAAKLFEWCLDNCAGDWTQFAGKFYFSEESDAMMFTLVHAGKNP